MKWLSRKAPASRAPENRQGDRLRTCEQRRGFYQASLLAVLGSLRAFFEENRTETGETAKADLEGCIRSATVEEKLEVEQKAFTDHHRAVSLELRRMGESWRKKEGEFREMIGVLTRAMTDAQADNRAFGEKVHRQGEAIETISRLEDVRQMRRALQREVALLQAVVREKQIRDAETIEKLSGKVSALESELKASRQVSMRDGLTGLYNEEALNRYLKSMVNPEDDSRSPFSMMVADIDRFDRIETAYGEALAQRVILAAAQVFQSRFQGDELLARYRKGTFVALLPGRSRKEAVSAAKGLCRSMASRRYAIDSNLADHTLSFTISIGVSSWKRGDSAASVTARAVQALDAARRSGTGKVVAENAVTLFFQRGGPSSIEDLHGETESPQRSPFDEG
jgi:diguanylate cyclase